MTPSPDVPRTAMDAAGDEQISLQAVATELLDSLNRWTPDIVRNREMVRVTTTFLCRLRTARPVAAERGSNETIDVCARELKQAKGEAANLKAKIEKIKPLIQRVAGNPRFMQIAGPCREALNILKE